MYAPFVLRSSAVGCHALANTCAPLCGCSGDAFDLIMRVKEKTMTGNSKRPQTTIAHTPPNHPPSPSKM